MKILKNLGSLAFVLLIAGSLQAGGHASSLKWYSDGGVDLITFEDKEVIHLSKEQLGSYFGKGKQPYKGKKIAITVNNSGPKGGISGPLHRCALPGRSLPEPSSKSSRCLWPNS